MSSNILFLDIDEVLNCNREETDKDHINVMINGKKTGDLFNPNLCFYMNKLIDRYNFKIVVSSTWRINFSIDELKYIINNQMKINGEIIDVTTCDYLDTDYKERLEWDPKNACARDRGLQITQWLDQNWQLVNKYLVIDDGLDASYGHEANYFRTAGEYGFDEYAYLRCINKFDKYFLDQTDMVLVNKEFLLNVSGFLTASSWYSDMSKLPYSSFQYNSHYLGRELEKIIGQRNGPSEPYSCYDTITSMRETDPKSIDFAKELDKVLGIDEEKD